MTEKSLLVRIGADLSKLDQGLNTAMGKIGRAGQSLKAAGMAMTAAITLPILGIGAAAFKMSKDFNEAMANVATLIPGNTQRINELKGEVQDLAVSVGKGTKDMAVGLYQVVSALGDSSDSMKILDINARAGAAGLATTLEAINLTTAVTKGYGDVSAEATQKAADLAFQTVKLGQTTFPELAGSMGAVIPIGAALKVTQEELFTGFATLTGVTGDASNVSVQLKGILTGLMKPTEGMSAAIHELGYENSQAIVQELGMVGALRAVIGTTDGSAEAVGKLFANVRALPAVFALTGGQAEVFDQKLIKMKDSSGAMNEAFKEQTEGVNKLGFTWSQLKTKVEVTAQRFGDALAPVFAKIMDLLSPLIGLIQKGVSFFAKMPAPLQSVFIALTAVVAAAGPLLLIVGKFMTMLPALSQAFAVLSGPLGIITAAIMGLIFVGTLLVLNWDKVKAFLIKIWEPIKAVFVAAWTTIKEVFESVVNAIIGICQPFFNAVAGVATSIANAVVGAFVWLKNKAVSIYQAVAEFIIDKLIWLMDKIAKIPIVKKFVKNLEEGLAAAKAAIAESKTKMAEETEEAQLKIEKSSQGMSDAFTAVGTSAQEMKKVISDSYKELVDIVKQHTLSEYEYKKWSLDQWAADKKAAIEAEKISEDEKNKALAALDEAYRAQQAELDEEEKEKERTRQEEHLEKLIEGRAAYQQYLQQQDEAYKTAKQNLIDAINQLTMSELDYQIWAMDQEYEKRKADIDRTIRDEEEKAELLALLDKEYRLKKEKAYKEHDAKLTRLEENTLSAISSLYGNFLSDTLTAFEEWGEGKKGILEGVGDAFKSLVADAIGAIKQLVTEELMASAKTILAEKAKAIASIIAKVMASVPFPFNLAIVGAAIAAVTALFSKIKLFGEGGVAWGPQLAVVGEKGPELILPLSRAGEMRGMGTSFKQNVYFYGNINNAGSMDEISDRLAEKVRRSIEQGRK